MGRRIAANVVRRTQDRFKFGGKGGEGGKEDQKKCGEKGGACSEPGGACGEPARTRRRVPQSAPGRSLSATATCRDAALQSNLISRKTAAAVRRVISRKTATSSLALHAALKNA